MCDLCRKKRNKQHESECAIYWMESTEIPCNEEVVTKGTYSMGDPEAKGRESQNATI